MREREAEAEARGIVRRTRARSSDNDNQSARFVALCCRSHHPAESTAGSGSPTSGV